MATSPDVHDAALRIVGIIKDIAISVSGWREGGCAGHEGEEAPGRV